MGLSNPNIAGTDESIINFIQSQYDAGSESVHVCAHEGIELRGVQHVMLAVCHSTSKLESQATPGSLDLYVLKRIGDALAIASQIKDVESGSMGKVGDVEVVRLGASV